MCGILGVHKFNGAPVDEALVTRMRDSMAHRGPDGAGVYVDGPVALAHRRLSIFDLSPAGHQPMCNEDGTLWITFNGEIYNWFELADGLRARGHRFHSATDTETILHLYEEVGERCVDQLNGMFAFLIWDAKRRVLFGARDRLGIKPFYYYHSADQFVCASEIKAIVTDPGIARRPNPEAIADYLFAGAPLSGKTFFRDIAELPPGHTIRIENGRVTTRKYWDVSYSDDTGNLSDDELIDALRELLRDSVRIQCRSDAPVGCHLSGGLDSSTVSAFAAQFIDSLKTFSIRFDVGGYYDETPLAKAVSRFIGSQYIEMTATRENLVELYPALIWHMDQPPAGGGDAGFSYYSAARLAASHVKVALTGHGGDEVFGGYPAQFMTAFPGVNAFASSDRPAAPDSSLRQRLARVIAQEGLRGLLARAAARLKPGQPLTPEELWVRLHCSVEPARNPMLARAFQRNLNGYSPREHYLQPFRGSPAKELFDICLYHDLRVYLPQLLHKEDRASMAVSLESRLPLLDHRIVELMARIPGQRKVPGMVPKGMLRAAARNVLPPEVANRKDKMPFAVPMNEWLTQDLRRFAYEILTSEATLDRGIFDPDVIRSNQLGVEQMLGMLNVELWARVFVDGDTTLPIDTASAGAFAA